MRHTQVLLLFIGIAAGGCKNSPPARQDAPNDAPQAGAPANTPGVKCGPKTCAAGEVCCNASCGICTPPDGMCTQQMCDETAGPADPTASGQACAADADCRVFADYCTGCDCRALARGESDPACTGPGVRCLANPCQHKTARCTQGKCVVVSDAR